MSAAYLVALTKEIERKLQLARTSPTKRRELMHQLFADVALEVDNRARDILHGREEDVVHGYGGNASTWKLCFYDVLAGYYGSHPDDGRPILDLIVKLWSQSSASHIFSLLFHKWLFEVRVDDPGVLRRYSFALVHGATNVFWIDIQTNARHFHSLFNYLLDVALDPSRSCKIPVQAQRDLFLLLSRFLVFYGLGHKLAEFLKSFPQFPNAFFVGGPADVFVIELTEQLLKLKIEPVLLHYLSNLGILEGEELRMTTSTRLKTCLYSLTSPGGPMYPTRNVRYAAWDALDTLFPVRSSPYRHRRPRVVAAFSQFLLPFSWQVGRYPRHLISLFFRLLYPWYWPSSCWNFTTSFIQSLFRPIFSSPDHASAN